jgi:hypothetical protein
MTEKWTPGDYEPLTLGDYHAALPGEEMIVTLAVPLRRDDSVTIWIDATPLDDSEVSSQIDEIIRLLNSH